MRKQVKSKKAKVKMELLLTFNFLLLPFHFSTEAP